MKNGPGGGLRDPVGVISGFEGIKPRSLPFGVTRTDPWQASPQQKGHRGEGGKEIRSKQSQKRVLLLLILVFL